MIYHTHAEHCLGFTLESSLSMRAFSRRRRRRRRFMCARVCGATRTNSTTHSRLSLSLFCTPLVWPLALSLTLHWSLWMPNQPIPHLMVPLRLRIRVTGTARRIDQIVRPTDIDDQKDNNTAYCCRSLPMVADRCRPGTAKTACRVSHADLSIV